MKNKGAGSSKQIGLALGGGGVRGLAHVGVLKVFEAARIEIDFLSGTSMGGVIGAMYAAGMSAAQIEEEVLLHSSTAGIRKLIDFRPSVRGFVRGERIFNLIADTIGQDIAFADLDRPLAMVAVDARSGCQVILNEGSVVDAVRATISVPGIFQPVEIENMTLIDGGVLNNVPTDVAHGMGANFVIAIDVMPDFSQNTPGEPLVVQPIDPPSIPSLFRDALHIEYIMISALTNAKLQTHPPDVLLRPEIPLGVDLLIGFERAQEVIDAGERAALRALPDISTQLDE